MKWVKFSQAWLPLAVWVLCLRQQIEMCDFFPHISELNHRYYFRSPESPTKSHKTRIFHSDEYIIYIEGFFSCTIEAELFASFSFHFPFLWHCICYCLDTWQLFLAGIYIKHLLLHQFFLDLGLKHFSFLFLPPATCFWSAFTIHMTFHLCKHRVKSLGCSTLLFPFFFSSSLI